jgi:hypothetical protein
MRVITTDENYHTVLHAGRINDIEVIEETPIVCKVGVKGMQSPVKFIIAFKISGSSAVALGLNESRIKEGNRGKKGASTVKADLKVYISSSYKEPNE